MFRAGSLRRQLKLASNVSSEEGIAFRVVDSTNPSHLQCFVLSPEFAPTANYIFRFDIKFPEKYPSRPPEITALNRMWHPKISPCRGGNVCLYYLQPYGWDWRTSITSLMLTIRGMLGYPGDLDSGDFLNKDAFEGYISNQQEYNKKALEWAQEDNEGYGVVQFEDLRLSAIQSLLDVPGIVSYKCLAFCCRVSTHCFRLTVVVIPKLHMYCEKMIPSCGSIKITQPDFEFKSSTMCLTASEDSIDKCWKIKMSSSTFEKEKVDQFDPRKDPAPRCSVTIEWIRPERPPHRLIHKFYIKDCNDDTEIKAFDVCIDPGSLPWTVEPTLPLLLHLPVAPNRHVNLAEEVGDKFEFGVHLLNDTSGKITENIHSEEKGSIQNINRKILMRWLDGQGKPVTWESFVSVLRSIKLYVLATMVENAVS